MDGEIKRPMINKTQYYLSVNTLFLNRHIVGEIISNSHSDTLAEETVGISYDSDPKKAIKVIVEALEKISDTRKSLVGIEDFADSSINIGIRFWALTNCYFETRYLANAAIYTALLDANIKLPFPQREIRILGES